MVYNLISCRGFGEASGFLGSMGCIQGRVGLVLLFFVFAILRKWGGEEVGLDFNLLFALILSIVPYFIIITILGSFKFALIIGLLGGLLGGYGGGVMFGGSEGGY